MKLFMGIVLLLLTTPPCSAYFQNFDSGSLGELATTGCVVDSFSLSGDYSLYLAPGGNVTYYHQWGPYQLDFDYIFLGANYWSHYRQLGNGVVRYTASQPMYIDNFSVISVPEPSVLVCLGAGLLGLVIRRKVEK
jgi:hypothetical protein